MWNLADKKKVQLLAKKNKLNAYGKIKIVESMSHPSVCTLSGRRWVSLKSFPTLWKKKFHQNVF